MIFHKKIMIIIIIIISIFILTPPDYYIGMVNIINVRVK